MQTHAGAALVNFSEQCPKALLVKYLPLIVAKMQKVLQVRLEEVSGGGREGRGGGKRGEGKKRRGGKESDPTHLLPSVAVEERQQASDGADCDDHCYSG